MNTVVIKHEQIIEYEEHAVRDIFSIFTIFQKCRIESDPLQLKGLYT